MSDKRDNPQKEMPFLDHLEELRQMLFKVIITLLIAVIVAFVFHDWLFDVMRKPVEFAKLGLIEENHLPSNIKKKDWEKIKRIANAASSLEGKHRTVFLDHACPDEEMRLNAKASILFRAALSLRASDDRTQPLLKRRIDLIDALPISSASVRDRARLLVQSMPDAKLNQQGNLIEMTALGPAEGFMLSIKLSFFAAFILSFPLLLYFVAQFVLPGLTFNEKKVILPLCALGFGLFLIGVLFCYFIAVPEVLKFFHGYNTKMGVESNWRIGDYVSFVTKLTLGFGLCFELPVIVIALVKLGLLDDRLMRRTRAYAIVIIVIIAAIITPTPDAVTLSFLAVPMIILYEISIWIAWFLSRKARRKEAEEEAELAAWRERKRLEKKENAPKPDAASGTVPTSDEAADRDDDDVPDPAYSDDNDYLVDRSETENPVYEEGFGPGEKSPESPTPTSESSLSELDNSEVRGISDEDENEKDNEED